MAASMASRGCEVRLYEHPDFKSHIDAVNERGGCIELGGRLELHSQVALATTDMGAAMEETEILMIVVPAFAQETMLRLAAPHLRSGQIVVLLPGNFGSLWARNLLKEVAAGQAITLAETNTIPFACRMEQSGKVDIFGIKTFVEIAALPAVETPRLLSALRDIFPTCLQPAPNVLAAAFGNFNMLVHCPTVVMNTGWIETTKGSFDFYGEGITESVCRVVDRMDEERRAIGSALGLSLEPLVDWWQRAYPTGIQSRKLRDIIVASRVHSGHGASAPKSVSERYLTEDVPYLLVPVASLGNLTQTPAPVTNAVITLASALMGTDYGTEGRTVQRMGLAGMGGEQIQHFVQHGVYDKVAARDGGR